MIGKPLKGVADEIVDPKGIVWRVGDRVVLMPHPDGSDPRRTVETLIAGIFPGNGSWDQHQPHGDSDAVWFSLANGWMARPWLLINRTAMQRAISQ